MRRYLLDTGILGDYIYKRSGIPSRITTVRSKGGLIGTTMPVIGEVYFGAQYSNDPMHHLRALSHRLPQLTCWPLTREAAEKYGEIAALEKWPIYPTSRHPNRRRRPDARQLHHRHH